MESTILVVDDEALIRWSLVQRLTAEGYFVIEAGTAKEALQKFRNNTDLVLLDYKLPDGDGLQVLKAMKAAEPEILVILLTAFSTIETAVEAMKQGAYHYANKPFNLDEIALVVAKALETTRLRREVKALRASRSEPYAIAHIIGESPAMMKLKALLQKVAASPASTVLLTGESGTGKDLAAKTIHYNSDRAAKPFMNITCSALPRRCSRASCSDTSAAPSPTRVNRSWACSNRPKEAQSFSTRSARWCRHSRPSCCASWKRKRSSGSAAPATCASTPG